MTSGLIFETLQFSLLRKSMLILLEEDRFTQHILGFGKAVVRIKERSSSGCTTRNIHFYDEQLSSVKEPNSSQFQFYDEFMTENGSS